MIAVMPLIRHPTMVGNKQVFLKGKRNWSRAARIGEQDVFEGFRT
jgi:hypothetical protein